MGAAGARADGLAGEVAVHRRHFDVHEHGVALAGFHRRHGRGAVGGLGDHEAAALERAPHEQARARVVVDDEYVDRVRQASSALQATLMTLSSASSSDSATVRCARSLVMEAGSSEMSPLRADVSR